MPEYRPPPELLQFLKPYERAIRNLALKLRSLVLEEMVKHVNLGFNQGARLDDPMRILKGSGTQIRHITIKTLTDLERPEIRAYVRRALRAARDDAHKPGETIAPLKKADRVISTVKAIYPKKRRPKSASKISPSRKGA